VVAAVVYNNRRKKKIFMDDTLHGVLQIRREPHGGYTLRFIPDEGGDKIVLTIGLTKRL
jgi:hypothetical protein